VLVTYIQRLTGTALVEKIIEMFSKSLDQLLKGLERFAGMDGLGHQGCDDLFEKAGHARDPCVPVGALDQAGTVGLDMRKGRALEPRPPVHIRQFQELETIVVRHSFGQSLVTELLQFL
jgi:hypothetical protein